MLRVCGILFGGVLLSAPQLIRSVRELFQLVRAQRREDRFGLSLRPR
jgi:hypothetical protein